MVDIRAMVYVSTATRALPEQELRCLAQKAAEKNRRFEVTGLLLYRAGAFMQYLEGPRDGVSSIYQSIRYDPRHFGLVELGHAYIRQREFTDFAMGLRMRGLVTKPSPGSAPDEIETRLAGVMNHEAPLKTLLQSFWNWHPVR